MKSKHTFATLPNDLMLKILDYMILDVPSIVSISQINMEWRSNLACDNEEFYKNILFKKYTCACKFITKNFKKAILQVFWAEKCFYKKFHPTKVDPDFPNGYYIRLYVTGQDTVGKSCLVYRFAQDQFISTHPVNLEDYLAKEINLMDHGSQMIVIFDSSITAYQKSTSSDHGNIHYWFGRMGIHGSMICFSITDLQSWEWAKEAYGIFVRSHESNFEIFPLLLVGTKMDQIENRKVESKEINDFCCQRGLEYVETSSKTGDNVNLALEKFIEILFGANIDWKSIERGYINYRQKYLTEPKKNAKKCLIV